MVSLRTVSLCMGLAVMIGGGAAIAAQTPLFSQPTAQADTVAQAPSPSWLLRRRVQQDLASRLNVPASSLQIVEATPQVWPDQCLGLARPNERCMGGEVSGWQVQVASPQQLWTYRSDRAGTRLRLEPLAAAPDFGTGDFSAEASRLLLQTVAEQTGVPASQLRVSEVQAATWDGCMGVYTPDYACTMIAIAGFRTAVTDGETVWIYHLNETAEQIAQNDTASGAQQPLLVSFMPVENRPEVSPDVVFQSQLSGDLAGSVSRTVLTADGQLYRESRSALGGTSTREVIKTLTAEEVEAFRTQLMQQRFANLNRLRYLSEAAFADYPTTLLQTPYASVEYIDLELDSLPPELRDVIVRWNQLIEADT